MTRQKGQAVATVLGARLERLAGPLDVDAGPAVLLHPHPPTARAAAERLLAVALHLVEPHARAGR